MLVFAGIRVVHVLHLEWQGVVMEIRLLSIATALFCCSVFQRFAI